jgi:SAM-dependent methyltransferase
VAIFLSSPIGRVRGRGVAPARDRSPLGKGIQVTSDPSVSDPAFWQHLYVQGSDRWELGRPSPSLAAHLERARPPRGTVAVPGCGRGHDARLLARHGYRVYGFDFVAEAISIARELAARDGVEVTFEDRDVFGLARNYRRFFDGVWEYTCYCAIDPARRPEYVEMLATILRPGGWLLACFFPMGEQPGGPPFAVSESEVRQLLGAGGFELIADYVPAESPDGRQDREWMVSARRRVAGD